MNLSFHRFTRFVPLQDTIAPASAQLTRLDRRCPKDAPLNRPELFCPASADYNGARVRSVMLYRRSETALTWSSMLAAMIVAMLFAGGCGLHAPSAPPPDSSTTLAPPAPTLPVAASSSSAAPASSSSDDVSAVTQANITRYFVSNPGQLGYSEEAPPPPGDAKLDNAKARQFPQFAYPLARQTLKAAQDLAPDKLSQRRLPNELKPVVLTAVMDPVGRLTEIEINQHSGDNAVDHLVIEACKRGLWARNPPPQALASDGNYRLRIEGIISNYSVSWHGFVIYATHVGLSIL